MARPPDPERCAFGPLERSGRLETQTDRAAATLPQAGAQRQAVIGAVLTVGQHLTCDAHRLPFQRAAPDGAHNVIRAHQQRGPNLARGGTLHA